MKSTTRAASAIFATLLVLAICPLSSRALGGRKAATPPKSVQLKETFDLRIGESATLPSTDAGLTIRFADVISDSRCPNGVTCVWAGNAVVRLSVQTKRTPATPFDLGTASEPREAVVDGYHVVVRNLTPRPMPDQPLEKKKYRVELRVDLGG